MRKSMTGNRGSKALVAALLALGVFVLSGCDRTGDVPTLVWWQIGTRQLNFAHDERVISDYVYSQIGVRVEFRIAGWADAQARFNTLINAGEYFDILFTDATNYNQFAALGAFADITDLVPEVAPELWDLIPNVLWDGVRIDGRILSIPTYKD